MTIVVRAYTFDGSELGAWECQDFSEVHYLIELVAQNPVNKFVIHIDRENN